MLKSFLLFFISWTLASSLVFAKEGPPKSEFKKFIDHPDYETYMYDSGPASTVMTSLLGMCAAGIDAVNYSCYYGKKWFGSDKPSPVNSSGNRIPFRKGTLPEWATPSETPTALSDIRNNRGRNAPAQTPTAKDPKITGDRAAASTATEECVWDMTRPPRIIMAPGCSTPGKCLCRGQVICGNKSRVAVCSENFCKENSATACAKQLRYSSKVVN